MNTLTAMSNIRLVAFDVDGVFTDGRFYLSDVVVNKPVPDAAKANVDLWTA